MKAQIMKKLVVLCIVALFAGSVWANCGGCEKKEGCKKEEKQCDKEQKKCEGEKKCDGEKKCEEKPAESK